MENVHFVKPQLGVEVGNHSGETPIELAVRLRKAIKNVRSTVVSAATMDEIAQSVISDNDTAWMHKPVRLADHPTIFEVEVLDPRYVRDLHELGNRPAEPIVMPLHVTSILFCALHDRNGVWYCTSILTCEDERLLAGNPENPMFVWITH